MTDTLGTEQTIQTHIDNVMACFEVGKALTATHEIDEILALIMEKVSALIPAQNWSLLLIDPDSGELAFDIVVGLDRSLVADVRIAPGEGIAGQVAQAGEMVIVPDAGAAPGVTRRIDRLTGFVTESIVCIPLKINGKILGVIEVINLADMERFRSSALPMLRILADYAAIAIANSRFVEKIHRMSITEEYTGLYNARYMHQVLEGLVAQADAGGRGVSVVFMDMDNFKAVVDTYGHLAGSRVLKEVGEVIRACLGGDDTLFKYGGDEYVILLPGRTPREARRRIGQVLEALREAAFLKSEGVDLKVTASFGMASYPQDAATKKELLLMADRAMYGVKRSTKNGVAVVSGH